MHLDWFRTRTPREWVVLLLLPALGFRMLVPAGFMPVADHGVAVTMQMCHGDAQSALVIRLAGGGERPGDHTARHDPACAFAASAAVAPPPILSGPLTECIPSDPAGEPSLAGPATRLLHRAQSQRAPPVIV